LVYRTAVCTGFEGVATGDGNLPGSIPLLSVSKMEHSSQRMTALYSGEIPIWSALHSPASYWKKWKMKLRLRRLYVLEKNGAAYENRTHA